MQSIPSADLLNAALVDIQFGGSSGDHSAEYPFSLAELQLLQQQMDLQQQQQQQQQQQMQAGGAHLDFMDAPASPLSGGMMLGGMVDAAPFLADDGMSFSQLGSIDWGSFNASFTGMYTVDSREVYFFPPPSLNPANVFHFTGINVVDPAILFPTGIRSS